MILGTVDQFPDSEMVLKEGVVCHQGTSDSISSDIPVHMCFA